MPETKRNFDLYLMKEWVFIDIGKGYMLCIGRKEEVDNADVTRIAEMISEALVTSRYHSMTSKGQTPH